MSSSVWGQNFHKRSEVSSAVQKKYEKARSLAQANRLDEALDLYIACQKKDPLFFDAFYRAAQIHAYRGELEKAEKAFEVCLKLSPTYRKDLSLNLGLLKKDQEEYEASLSYFEQYLSNDIKNTNQLKVVEKLIEEVNFLANVGPDIPFDPKPLKIFNTEVDEYLPSIGTEGNEFVFTRKVLNEYEDFYRSEKDSLGNWVEATPYEAMNTPLDEGARSISADGKIVVVTYCYQEGGLGSCDLYISELKNGQWSKYRNLGAVVNSSKFDSQPSISANGEKLIFCSNRDGGFGGRDLYVSKLKSDNTWGTPVNLGPTINTEKDDKTPFLHPDGRTLYFMSNGHPGFGGFDLFVSRLDDDGNWSKPENLGKPLNSELDEGMLIVDFKGEKGYLATDRNLSDTDNAVRGTNYDLYEFNVYERMKPKRAVFVRGKVYDAETNKTIEASIELVDIMRTDFVIGRETETDGDFLFVLEDDREYGLFVQSEGYIMHSMNFNLREDELESKRNLEIYLRPIEEEQGTNQTVLENVFFETGLATLQEKSFLELNKLADLILENNISIRIVGHTDNVGTEEANQLLSEARAKTVVDYLSSRGVDKSKLFFEGRGESEPIADNETAVGRKKNRRTSFIVLD
jgi:outer membrane protein OmpA-like peptidoglycan-associated protein